MRRTTWTVAGAAMLVVAAAMSGVTVLTGRAHAAASHEPPPNTGTVERGTLSTMVSGFGILTYKAQPDGSPYTVFNQARGMYTELPTVGDRIDCGEVLYRVDDKPVLLLCGSTPTYRSLVEGDRGGDVAELNANLVQLGYATRAQLDPTSRTFSSATGAALERLQSKLGQDATGSLNLGRAVFLPDAVRIATVAGELGGPAPPGAPVARATSDTPEVHVALDSSQQGQVEKGDQVEITLPDNASVRGTVDRLGRVAQAPAGPNAAAASATVPAYISLDHPDQAHGLDQAPVQVSITTRGVDNALNVPVTAIFGKAGGGFAVEVVHADGRRNLVAVKLGLFDSAGARVQVDGDLRAGDRVVVPSP